MFKLCLLLKLFIIKILKNPNCYFKIKKQNNISQCIIIDKQHENLALCMFQSTKNKVFDAHIKF